MMWLCLSKLITGIPATSFPNHYQQATVPLKPSFHSSICPPNDGRQVILHSSCSQRSVSWEGPAAGRECKVLVHHDWPTLVLLTCFLEQTPSTGSNTVCLEHGDKVCCSENMLGFEMGEHVGFEAYARELPVLKCHCHPECACEYTEENPSFLLHTKWISYAAGVVPGCGVLEWFHKRSETLWWSDEAAEVAHTIVVFQLPILSQCFAEDGSWLKCNFDLGTACLNFSLAVGLCLQVTQCNARIKFIKNISPGYFLIQKKPCFLEQEKTPPPNIFDKPDRFRIDHFTF